LLISESAVQTYVFSRKKNQIVELTLLTERSGMEMGITGSGGNSKVFLQNSRDSITEVGPVVISHNYT